MKYLILFCMSLLLCAQLQAQSYNISYATELEKLNQLSPVKRDWGCWLYSATMMYSWKHKVCTTPEKVAALATQRSNQKNNYSAILTVNKGLAFKQMDDFTKAMGWTALSQSPTVESLYNLLRNKGPLYFLHRPTENVGATGHVMVIIGLSSNNLKDPKNSVLEVFDPWDGKRLTMNFQQYAQKYLQLPSVKNYLFHY